MANPTTRDEAITAYLANADYADGAGDAAKARAFRTACRALLVLQPTRIAQDGLSREISVESLPKELKQVDDWLTANDSASVLAGAAFTRGRALL